ncbi:hypothetical protein P9112_000926 [Eukaryota sp. TZLM1-RC]
MSARRTIDPNEFEQKKHELQSNVLTYIDSLIKTVQTSENHVPKDLHRKCFHIVYRFINDDFEDASDFVEAILRESLDHYLPAVSSDLEHFEGKHKLYAFDRKWREFQKVQVGYVTAFAALDYQKTSTAEQGQQTVVNIVRQEFYNIVFRPLKDDLCTLLLEHIDNERNGLVVDPSILRSTCQLLAEMETVQKGTFEALIYSDLQIRLLSIYSAVRESLRELSFMEYFVRIKKFIDKESSLLHSFVFAYVNHLSQVMPQQSLKGDVASPDQREVPDFPSIDDLKTPLLIGLYSELYGSFAESSLEGNYNSFANMLNDSQNQDLNIIYSMAYQFDQYLTIQSDGKTVSSNVTFLTGKFELYLTDRYNHITSSKTKSTEVVLSILDLIAHSKDLVAKAFNQNPDFQLSFNKIHKENCRQIPQLPASLAQTIHKLMTVDFSRQTEEEITKALNKCLDLYIFLSDKLSFEDHHKSLLAERLLNGSSNIDYEADLTSLFKNEFGMQVYQTFSSMINDITASQATISQFQATISLPFNFSPTVITAGKWPFSFFTMGISLPSIMEHSITAFSQFYTQLHQARKLAFQPNLGTIDLEFTPHGGNSYFITCPTFEGLVLLQFNQASNYRITFGDVLRGTNLPRDEAMSCIISLLRSGLVVKRKDQKVDVNNPDIPVDFVFALNIKFKSRSVKVVIQRYRSLEAKTKSRIESDLSEKRDSEIDAVIVRLMKTNKVLPHRELLSQTANMLSERFPPDVDQIKRRIAHLMEKEYLKRSDNDRSVYEYIS